jgi:molybdenum cofactor biosynthesis protein B
LNFAIITVSDTRTEATDKSGDALAERIEAAGHRLAVRELVKDDVHAITAEAKAWSSDTEIQIILTTGGTGLTGRDVTVEAIKPLFDKTLDGFSVLFHHMSLKTIGLATLQSRACAGLINGTFVFCLPGSTKAVTQIWDEIIRDALDSRYRPTSLIDLIPRLKE